MRVTHALVQIAAALMAAPEDRHWGYRLSDDTGVLSGALYPRLAQMLGAGWLEKKREPAGTAAGRPPRAYYTLTEKGRTELGVLLARAATDPRFATMDLGQYRRNGNR
ncbi:PadR family transcriptional regulator [Amycolatopsis sp. NPDC004079]|uniref:PadR family transcriptional regulator n=1 Tax=Amycolatopsis sp. NPDC004079 TaxID=3154549 RepID=UPI0033ADE069